MKNQIQENVFLNHFDVSRETMSKLSQFSRILISQNQKVNIIGNSTTKNIWIRHFADSAKIFTILENLDKGCQKERFLCDVGTGGGLPGFVLAILNQQKRLKTKYYLILQKSLMIISKNLVITTGLYYVKISQLFLI